jgi:hypothetical protein
MACGITSGLSITCQNLKKVGGVKKVAYLFNISDLTSYTIDGSGYITALNFAAYAGLYKFQGRKQSHSGGYTAVIQDPGGNKFFQHDVTIKGFAETPADNEVLEDLLVSEVGVILQTTNNAFVLYGAYNGLEESAGTQNTGTAPASDVSDNVTLTGAEQNMPKYVLITDAETTLDYLESLVV